jgi:hypothetical protein
LAKTSLTLPLDFQTVCIYESKSVKLVSKNGRKIGALLIDFLALSSTLELPRIGQKSQGPCTFNYCASRSDWVLNFKLYIFRSRKHYGRAEYERPDSFGARSSKALQGFPIK